MPVIRKYRGNSGATVVALGITSSPAVAAYKFRVDTGWGARYSNPGTAYAFTGGPQVAFAPNNSRVLVSNNTVNTIRQDLWSESAGFGTASTVNTGRISISFNPTGTRVLLSGVNDASEYNFSDSGLGAVFSSVGFGGGIGRWSRYILDGNFFVVSLSATNSLITYPTTSGTPAFAGATSFFGLVNQFSMSPITHSGTRIMAVVDGSNAVLRPWPVNVTTGVFSAQVTSTVGSGVNAVCFDSRGRLFVGYTSGNLLRMYSLNSAGAQTLVATASDFTGGSINYLAYDDVSDVLFVGSSSAPFVTAYRIGGNGFLAKYPDPPTSVGSSVITIALQYGDAWKSDRVN